MLSQKFNYLDTQDAYSRYIAPVDEQTNFLARFVKSIGGTIEQYLPGYQERMPVDTQQKIDTQIQRPPQRYIPLKYENFQTLPPTVQQIDLTDKGRPVEYIPAKILRRKIVDYFSKPKQIDIIRTRESAPLQ